jgi:hypothetical protein
MTEKLWLTPETAIGCRLPCGATVESVAHIGSGLKDPWLNLDFDRKPKGIDGHDECQKARTFLSDGSHEMGTLPNLIPPTPAQPGVMVTREAAVRAAMKMGLSPPTAGAFADALGIPPDPPKVAPWEKAFADWHNGNAEERLSKIAFEAGVMFAVGQIGNSADIRAQVALEGARRRIMGDQA